MCQFCLVSLKTTYTVILRAKRCTPLRFSKNYPIYRNAIVSETRNYTKQIVRFKWNLCFRNILEKI